MALPLAASLWHDFPTLMRWLIAGGILYLGFAIYHLISKLPPPAQHGARWIILPIYTIGLPIIIEWGANNGLLWPIVAFPLMAGTALHVAPRFKNLAGITATLFAGYITHVYVSGTEAVFRASVASAIGLGLAGWVVFHCWETHEREP